ncbi:MAG TPA: ROK family protein [Marmoricola sp.]|nr:ROK family protein [Marmoricola sp.]HNJ79171.1 ROK family protein [Marmoricola sp.]HNO39845.1 ROK family protein [Marmoricola sp.]
MGTGDAVGVDIGGTKILAAIVSESGAITTQLSAETPSGATDPGQVEDALVSVLLPLLAESGPVPVGIAAAGLVDAGQGVVRFAPHLPWRNEPLRTRLAQRLEIQDQGNLVVENDVNAALCAEIAFGAAKSRSAVLMVTVGTGIGGAILAGGRLYRGLNGLAGEFGHLPFDTVQSRPCPCGLSGCWEQYVSGPALSHEMRILGREMSGPQILAAARDGDQDALAVFTVVGMALGQGLAQLVTSLDPEMILVGGGVSEAGELLLEPARRALANTVVGSAFREPPELALAALGASAGVIGAAELARRQIES